MRNNVKLPYGISNFERLVTQNYKIIDKTGFIEQLENLGEPYIFFLRPRRFGKSLFISTLMYYYDINHRDKFDKLFKDLYIGKNPTPLKNSYNILFFEFSRIDTRNIEVTYNAFLERIKSSIEVYCKNYDIDKKITEGILLNKSPEMVMTTFFKYTKEFNHKIYIMIDEYDHFANKMMVDNLSLFQKMVQDNGFMRLFYETIKTATFDNVVDRLFVTGVTPITLDSMTSGFNIGSNLTAFHALNEMHGFTKEEVFQLINVEIEDKEKVVDFMQKLYNGYLFSTESDIRVYNSDMVLYFLKYYNAWNKAPRELIDINIASDYGKIKRMFLLGEREENYYILQSMLNGNEVYGNLTPQFSFEKDFDRNDFLSLLFYMGMITIDSARGDLIKYTIPNFVIKRLYWEFFANYLKERKNVKFNITDIQNAIMALAYDNKTDLILKELEKVLKMLSNRDYLKFDEKYIQLLFITLINHSKLYYIKSENEVKQRYPDVMLMHRPPYFEPHQFLFEFKYMKKTDNDSVLRKLIKEGRKQVGIYRQIDEIRDIKDLKSYLVIFKKDEMVYKEEL